MTANFMELAKARFSVKKFSDKPIEEDKLEQILEAGRIAPTAANKQAQRVYVIQSEDALAKISALSPCIYGAKTVLMIAYDADEDWKNSYEDGIHSGQQDASIVATHIMLEAWDLGIGSCWVNMFPNTKAAQAFGLPDNIKPVLLMPIGYAAEGVKPLAKHTSRKPLDATVTRL
ncbi:MAG: nitroreductase family protein [Pseudoramibacter sp.]